ncbi:MAG: hypothetical protein ABJC74_12925 [Gemmatimonadota bacterium]
MSTGLSALAIALAIAASLPAAPVANPVTSDGTDSTAQHPAPMPALAPLRPLLGTKHFEMLMRKADDSVYRLFGREIAIRSAEQLGTMAVLRNVAHYDWVNGKVTTDTTVSLAESLAPVSERTHTPSRIVSYDFQRLHSTGQMGPAGTLAPIDDQLPQPAFNSTDLDMLVTALPLTAQFHVPLPLYDPEFPGFRMAELQVTGSEEVNIAGRHRRAWVLAVDQPGRPTMYYRLDMTTHAMLQKDFGSPAGPAFRVQSMEETQS